jgi:hypothetical protein
VSQRVQQCDPPALRSAAAALGHLRGGQEFGTIRPGGLRGHGYVEAEFERSAPPRAGDRAGGLYLLSGTGGREDGTAGLGYRPGSQSPAGPSAWAVGACVSGGALSNARAICA